jgi:hypothetical protein
MSIEDKHACAEVIQAWGFYRDQGRWAELLTTFHQDGEIAVSWFKGAFSEFVERCKHNMRSGSGRSKHLLWPSTVRVSGDRALAETNVAILVRQTIDGVLVDLTSFARFLDRLERRAGRWAIRERAAVYEQDRLDPVEPSEAFTRMMQAVDFSRYPLPYRYMGYRVAASGRLLAVPVYAVGAADTEQLIARYAAWFEGA